MAWSFLQLWCSLFGISVDVVFLLLFSHSTILPCALFVVMWSCSEPHNLKWYESLVCYANILRFIASKGVLAWKVKSQWVLWFSQAVRLRARYTGKDYVELDRVYFVQRSPRPTPSPTIATDSQIVDQPETIISHQECPQYLISRREGRLDSDSPDCGHLVNCSTSEREAQDEARPTASPVTLEQTEHHHQVAEPTNAASASGVVSAISEVPGEPAAFVGPAPTRPSISDRSQRLKQYRDKTARERGETPEQLQALLDQERALRTAEEAAPSTMAPTNQSQLPETDNTQEQSLISRLLFPPRNIRPRVPFKFRTRVVLVPEREPLFPVPSSRPRQRNVPTSAPTPEPSTAPAPAPEHTPQPTAPALVASRPVVTSTPTPQPVVTTEPTVSPEPILAVQLTPPEIAITPPSPVLVPKTSVEAVRDVIDEAIPGLPKLLAPKAIIQEIVTVPSVPAAPVVPQLQWVARDLTVSEQEMDDIMLQLEKWHVSTPVAVFAAPAVNEQDATGNAVLSPVSVPVPTTITSPADDPISSVAPSVEVFSLPEPVSASSLDEDVEMEEDALLVAILDVSEPSSDGDLTMTENDVAPAVSVDQSEDHDMQDPDVDHQALLAVSSDMELCLQHHAPETSIFGGLLDSLVPRAPAQPFWKLTPAFSSGSQAALGGINFASFPVSQTEAPELDMTDAPLAQASPLFAFGQQQAAATPYHAQVPMATEVEMDEQTYPDSTTVHPVPSSMASQPLPLPITPVYASPPSPQATMDSDMALVTPALQIITSTPSPEAPSLAQLVSSALKTNDIPIDPASSKPIDMPLGLAEPQVASPMAEQPAEQAPEPASELNEYRGVENNDPELWAQFQAANEGFEQHLQQQQEEERQPLEEPIQHSLEEQIDPELQEQLMQAFRDYEPERDAGVVQQQQESPYSPERTEAPEVHQTPPYAQPSFIPNVDEGNNSNPFVLSPPAPQSSSSQPATSQIFGSGPSSAAAVGFQPMLPVGAQGLTQEFSEVLAPDEQGIRLQMKLMEEQFQAGIALTRAELASARVQTEVVGASITGDDEPEDDESDDDESGDDQPPPIPQPTNQRTIAQPRSLLSRVSLNVAPFANMRSIGEPSPPTGSAVPSTEQNAGDEGLTRDERILLGMDPGDGEGVADEDLARRADAETMQRRGIRPLRRPRNLQQNNTND